MKENNDNRHINLWLLEATGPAVLYIVLIAVLKSLNGAAGAFYALLMKRVVDSAQAGAVSAFTGNLVRIGGLAIFQMVLALLLSITAGLAYFAVEQRFKERLFSQILHRDFAAVSAVHSGDWQTRLTSDTGIVSDAVVQIVPNLVGRLVKLLSALAMLIYLDAFFAACLVPACVVVFLLTLVFRRRLKERHRKVQEADSSYRVFLHEQLAGLMVTKAYSMEDKVLEEERGKIADHRRARLKRMYFSAACKTAYSAAVKVMTFMTLAYCCYGIMKGSLTAGSLTALMSLAAQVRSPFSDISGLMPKYMSMTASAERLREIEQVPEDAAGTTETLPDGFYAKELAALGMSELTFAYHKNGRKPVLPRFSFEIEKGSIIAFTGPSGCGKSTVLKLLLALYRPEGGQVYLRLADGERAALDASYRRLFAYVPQQNLLMKGTIREAVSFAAPEGAGDEEHVWRALELACAREFVEGLENGLDTALGERGGGLSEGQLQRLAIARAICSGRPVLLLDESTSALDEETEKQLLRNLRSMKEYTVIIVTHRMEVLSICDRVLHFSPEGIVERR